MFSYFYPLQRALTLQSLILTLQDICNLYLVGWWFSGLHGMYVETANILERYSSSIWSSAMNWDGYMYIEHLPQL